MPLESPPAAPRLAGLRPSIAAAAPPGDSSVAVVIEPAAGWALFDWKELVHYKDLLRFLVWRDVKTLYSQTVMGFAWAIIRPLFSMLVFTVVFGSLAKVPSDGVPYALFSFVGLLPWTYFSTALTASANSLVSNTQMLTKVYFPRVIIPVTPVLAGLVDFAVAAIFLVGLMVWYHVAPRASLAWAPVLLLLMVVTALGAGLWLSALAIQYRDVKHAITFISQLMMYATPVVWPASLIDRKLPMAANIVRPIYGFFVPMAGVIEGFRASLLGTGAMPWDLIVTGWAGALLVLGTGMLYFRRRERVFADVA